MQVKALSKLFADKTQQESEDLKKFRDRAHLLEGELSAVQKVSVEQDKKIGVLQKAAVTSKSTILNAQQRASEWEKKANERQQELDEQRKQIKETVEVRDLSVKEVELLQARIAQMEESERATSVSTPYTIHSHTFAYTHAVRTIGTRESTQEPGFLAGLSTASYEG